MNYESNGFNRQFCNVEHKYFIRMYKSMAHISYIHVIAIKSDRKRLKQVKVTERDYLSANRS
jgi:hypothetical protein